MTTWRLRDRGPIRCPVCREPHTAVVDLAALGATVPMSCGHTATIAGWLSMNAELVPDDDTVGVDPASLFDWYPLQRLDQFRAVWNTEPIDAVGTADLIVRARCPHAWEITYRRQDGRDNSGLPLWSEPVTARLDNRVTSTMERRNDNRYVFLWSADDRDPYVRLRDEINAAAEDVAARMIDEGTRR